MPVAARTLIFGVPVTSLWLDPDRLDPDRLDPDRLDTDRLATDRPGDVEPFVADQYFDVVIVGAGLTGLTTAVLLARAGRSVAVVEARELGAVTTGNTTGKISLLQGTQLSSILRNHTEHVARAYLDGNREGQAWLLRYCREHDVPFDVRDAFTYAGSPDGKQSVQAEFEACHQVGLDVTWRGELDLPFPTYGAVVLADQAQFNSMDVLEAMAADLKGRNGKLFEGVRVTGVETGNTSTLQTDQGTIRAGHVVLATGVPILDRGLYFAKLMAKRSYALAFRVPGSIPQGMYLSADSPTRSLRTAARNGAELLVVGGNGHDVGREASPKAKVSDLIAWTGRYFPGAELTHSWSAQDYVSVNSVPFVGELPRGGGHVFVGTGYGKWGMTNAVAAALRISAGILGGSLEWGDVLGKRVSGPHALVEGLKANVEVAAEAVRGWAESELSRISTTDESPAEGVGVVGREGVRPVAISTVDGVTCKVSAICPHLKGIVSWNDAEQSWDCPLHGSRFTADGSVLEGPATSGLERLSG